MSVKYILGIFSILHGLVHLLYLGQSVRYFELQPGMQWPDSAWAFSRIVGNESIRVLGAFLLVFAAAGFVASGLGILVQQNWSRSILIVASVFSIIIYVLIMGWKTTGSG